MKSGITKYFEQIEAKILQSSFIDSYEIIRKEVIENEGKIRIKITFKKEFLADLFEYIEFKSNKIKVKKYHFHLQDTNNKLVCRWDNAPHHKGLPNFPHHIHFHNDVVTNTNIPNLLQIIGEMEVMINLEI